jgi:hypothetical protein
MKTRIRLLLATGAFASSTLAGPAPQYWQRTKPFTTFTKAKGVGPHDIVTMQFNGCETVMIRDSHHAGPPSQGNEEWFALGSKHSRDECGGKITVVKGKAADSTQPNCSKCGEGAVTCCVAPAAEPKK